MEAEQKAAEGWEQRKASAYKEWTAKTVVRANAIAMEKRLDLTWLQTDTPVLDPAHFELNAFGRLPQWPVGVRDSSLDYQNAIASADRKIRSGDALWRHETNAIEHFGGMVAAKERHNLRVVQVFDDKHLLAAFLGHEAPLKWPLFLFDAGSTAKFADDSTLRAADLAFSLVNDAIYVQGWGGANRVRGSQSIR